MANFHEKHKSTPDFILLTSLYPSNYSKRPIPFKIITNPPQKRASGPIVVFFMCKGFLNRFSWKYHGFRAPHICGGAEQQQAIIKIDKTGKNAYTTPNMEY